MSTRAALRALGVGAATGLRSMTGPAFAFASGAGNWRWALRAAAVGEYIVDKLPNTPSRTEPGGLVARALAAGFAGAALDPDDRWTGAACAIAAAMAAAYGGAAYRRLCAQRKLPPFATALAEDGVAIALAWSATRKRG